jgi:hypothetical protein
MMAGVLSFIDPTEVLVGEGEPPADADAVDSFARTIFSSGAPHPHTIAMTSADTRPPFWETFIRFVYTVAVFARPAQKRSRGLKIRT